MKLLLKQKECGPWHKSTLKRQLRASLATFAFGLRFNMGLFFFLWLPVPFQRVCVYVYCVYELWTCVVCGVSGACFMCMLYAWYPCVCFVRVVCVRDECALCPCVGHMCVRCIYVPYVRRGPARVCVCFWCASAACVYNSFPPRETKVSRLPYLSTDTSTNKSSLIVNIHNMFSNICPTQAQSLIATLLSQESLK